MMMHGGGWAGAPGVELLGASEGGFPWKWVIGGLVVAGLVVGAVLWAKHASDAED